MPGHRVGHRRAGRAGNQRPGAVAVDREAEHDRPGRTGEGQPADRGGRGPVVDADHRQPGPARAGVHDRRQSARRDRVQDRVVIAGGPHDEPVYHRLGDTLHVAGGPGNRDQGEADAFGRADLRHAGQEPGRLRVVEGVGQPFAEDHSEAARPAPAQRPGARMRAGIAEPVRRRADLRRGAGRDPPGPGVDVGRRHHRHPGCVGDLAQGRPAPSLNHGYTVVVYRYTTRDAGDRDRAPSLGSMQRRIPATRPLAGTRRPC